MSGELVTGVQTCALQISARGGADGPAAAHLPRAVLGVHGARWPCAGRVEGAGRHLRRHVQRDLLPAARGAAPGPGRQGRRVPGDAGQRKGLRSEEHTSELQSLMRISSAVFCLQKKKKTNKKKATTKQ